MSEIIKELKIIVLFIISNFAPHVLHVIKSVPKIKSSQEHTVQQR